VAKDAAQTLIESAAEPASCVARPMVTVAPCGRRKSRAASSRAYRAAATSL